MSEKAMLDLANFYLVKHVQEHSDYAKRYEEMIAKNQLQEAVKVDVEKTVDNTKVEKETATNPDGAELIQKLKEFRLKQSREENIKAYYIFNDAQMQDLIAKNPQNRKELQTVAGFGKVKVEKYGDAILTILKGD